MPIRPARGSISRPTLIWIIVAGFLIASGIGVYFAIRRGSPAPAPPGAPINLGAVPPPPPPPPSTSPDGGIQGSTAGRIQLSDR